MRLTGTGRWPTSIDFGSRTGLRRSLNGQIWKFAYVPDSGRSPHADHSRESTNRRTAVRQFSERVQPAPLER